jgi:EmrB/QacA subfamily drug resistance transporter
MSICLLTLGLDITVLNVTLPTLVRDLGASTTQLQWMIDAYLLAFGGLLLTMGALGDRYGRRRLLLGALFVFLVGSLMCVFADTPQRLIFARGIQGVGAAAIVPLSLAFLPVIFPDEEERTKAIAIWAAANAIGLPLGPIVAGILLQNYWWGSVFLINIPMVAISLVASAALLPESRDATAPKIDVVGAMLTVLGLGSLLFGIITGPSNGWTDPAVLATIVAGVVLLGAFVFRESRAAQPMLDLKLFRDPRFAWAIVAIMLTVFGLTGLMFTLTQYLQFILGYSALKTGVCLLLLVFPLAVAANASARVVLRFGAKAVIATGLVATAAGMLLFSTVDTNSGFALPGWSLAVIGAGLGMAMAQATNCVMSAIPVAQAGRGSAILATMRQLGASMGVAILGSILATVYASRLGNATAALPAQAAKAAEDSVGTALQVAEEMGAQGTDLAQAAKAAFIDGMSIDLVIGAAVTLAGAVAVLSRLPAYAGRETSVADATRRHGPPQAAES